MKHVLSILCNNHFGVLNRISGLIMRRCYNIDSLTVAETESPDTSRMTITLSGDDATVEQIKKQLEKQQDVREIIDLSEISSVTREHVLVKIRADIQQRVQVVSVASIFRAGIVDVSAHDMIVELTGESSKIDAFIEIMKPFGVIQVVRSGITGLPRGAKE